jgi:hypothetical protein
LAKLNQLSAGLIYLCAAFYGGQIINTFTWIVAAGALGIYLNERRLFGETKNNNIIGNNLPLIVTLAMYFAPVIGAMIGASYIFWDQIKALRFVGIVVTFTEEMVKSGLDFVRTIQPKMDSKLLEYANYAAIAGVMLYAFKLSMVVAVPASYAAAGLGLYCAMQKPTVQQNVFERNLPSIAFALSFLSMPLSLGMLIAVGTYNAWMPNDWNQELRAKLISATRGVSQYISTAVGYVKDKVWGTSQPTLAQSSQGNTTLPDVDEQPNRVIASLPSKSATLPVENLTAEEAEMYDYVDDGDLPPNLLLENSALGKERRLGNVGVQPQ